MRQIRFTIFRSCIQTTNAISLRRQIHCRGRHERAFKWKWMFPRGRFKRFCERGDLKDNIMGCWLLHCNLSFPRQPLGVTHVNTLPEWSCESKSLKFSKSQKSRNDFDFKPFLALLKKLTLRFFNWVFFSFANYLYCKIVKNDCKIFWLQKFPFQSHFLLPII